MQIINLKKMMNLQEAINHANEVAETCDNKECANEHKQLADWLTELSEFKRKQAEQVTATGQQMLRELIETVDEEMLRRY